MQDSERIENKGRTNLEQSMMEKEPVRLYMGYKEDGSIDLKVHWGDYGFVPDNSAHQITKQFLESLEYYFSITSPELREVE